MSKHIQLSIADPCHENWDEMTQAEKGRFCASCQKQVIDFTNMSDSQLATFFKKPAGGSVCGRFYHDQLERDIEIPRKRIPWVKYFFQFALPAFLVSMKATAQGKVKAKITAVASVKPSCNMIRGEVDVFERKIFTGDTVTAGIKKNDKVSVTNAKNISGKVINENGDPVPFASVMIKGTKIGIMSDSIGNFKIENLVLQGDIILQISSVGYDAREMLINPTDTAKILLIQLNQRLMGEVVITNHVMGALKVRNAETFRKGEVKETISKKAKEELSNKPIAELSSEDIPMIKVYPNPVMAGTNINIGCQKLKDGYYVLQLSSQSGQQVLNRQTWIDGEMQVLNIEIPHVASGIYFLKLTNKETNKRFTQKIIVE